MALEYFDERFTNRLGHFPRGATYIHDAIAHRQRIVYARALLTDKVLYIDLLLL